MNDSDVLAYAPLETKNYLSDVFNAPFLGFCLSAVREDLGSLGTELSQNVILESFGIEVHWSISSFKTGKRNVSN